jgi:signal transduction histidine kinase
VVVTLGAIVSVGAIAIWQTGLAFSSQRQARAATLGEAAAELIAAGVEKEGRDGLRKLAGLAARATGAVELAIYDERGRPLEPPVPPPLPSDATAVPAAVAGAVPRAGEREPEQLVVYTPLRLGAGRGALRATFALDAELDALLARARNSVLVLGAADALVLLVLGAWMLRGTVVRPVRALEAAARRVAGGDLGATVDVRGPGELGRLADGFDRMTASLREGRESLIRSEKLAGVGRLAAGVAHEVGNPLAAILGYIETLLGETGERPIAPELRREVLTRVRAETERIHRIIQELLEHARPTAEEIAPVDVGRAVEAAVSLVRAQARGRGLTLDVDLPPGLPRARASAGRLTQVMVNLLLNAADATGGAGKVTVDARARGGKVVVGVADDGPGIAAEHRARLFEPFFSTKETGRGTGLGLSVSLAIVEAWGGTIQLVDGARGARFEVELPCARE